MLYLHLNSKPLSTLAITYSKLKCQEKGSFLKLKLYIENKQKKPPLLKHSKVMQTFLFQLSTSCSVFSFGMSAFKMKSLITYNFQGNDIQKSTNFI